MNTQDEDFVFACLLGAYISSGFIYSRKYRLLISRGDRGTSALGAHQPTPFIYDIERGTSCVWRCMKCFASADTTT